MRILLIQTAFLGDVILITPVIRELKNCYPEARIDALVRKGNEVLLSNNPHLNQVLIWDKKQKYQSLFRNLFRIRKQRYDEVICVQRYFNAGFLTTFSGAKHKVGFKQNPWSRFFNIKLKHELAVGKHEVERNLELVQHLINHTKSTRPDIFPSGQDVQFVQQFQEKTYYCLAPASVWFTKQLPEEKWIELCNQLPIDANVYLLGAPGDFELTERIAKKCSHPQVINLCGKLTLVQSAALMRHAERCFVNDSGPLHLASAVNAKVTAFFCSTVPAFGFGPLSDDAQILETQLQLECRPCGTHGFKSCPKDHFKCGFNIAIHDAKR